MLGIVASQVGLVTATILLVLAWSGWVTRVRAELPSWRNGVCMSALLLLSLDWLGIAVLELPVVVHPRMSQPRELYGAMLTLSHPLDILLVVLALALKRAPKGQLIVAAVLMALCWPLGYT